MTTFIYIIGSSGMASLRKKKTKYDCLDLLPGGTDLVATAQGRETPNPHTFEDKDQSSRRPWFQTL